MNHLLEYAHYGEALGNAASVIRSNAASAGLNAPVPTCPGWTVRTLVTHVGRVYRWAGGEVRGVPDRSRRELEAEARAATDLLDWFDDGLVDILNALGNAPEALAVPFFLPNAPASRLAWARRMAHESTIHAVDAMAARLGRVPTADEVWFTEAVAVDGIDELLTGFWPAHSDTGVGDLAVILDTGPAWILEGEAATVAPVTAAAAASVAARITGGATQVYLGLWNRGEVPGADPAVGMAWREQVRI